MNAVSTNFTSAPGPVIVPASLETEPAMLEFRCSHCWYSNIAECEASGQMMACKNCGENTLVPEPTKDRIARAQALLRETGPVVTQPAPKVPDKVLSDQALVAMAAMETRVPLNEMNFAGHQPASVTSRVLACLVDSALMIVTTILGVMLFAMLGKMNIVDPESSGVAAALVLPSIFAFTLMLMVGQWILISTQGQTIGKKLFMIRIVSCNGRLPGFVQGVILRNWLRALLSFVPFFTLLDFAFVLGDSRRCIHDLLAGTRVVDAF